MGIVGPLFLFILKWIGFKTRSVQRIRDFYKLLADPIPGFI